MEKSCLENSPSVTTVGPHRVTQEKCRAFLLKYKCRKCGKERHVARKCLSKPQNVNALDNSVSDDGQETYHLFTLDTHSLRSVSV